MNLYEFLENRDYEEIESYITDCISHNKNNELDEYRKLVLVLMLSEFFWKEKDFKDFYNNHQFDIKELNQQIKQSIKEKLNKDKKNESKWFKQRYSKYQKSKTFIKWE